MRVKIHCHKAIHQHKQFCLGVGWTTRLWKPAAWFHPLPGSHKSFFSSKTYFLQGSRSLTREPSYPEQESLISPSQSLTISTRVFSPWILASLTKSLKRPWFYHPYPEADWALARKSPVWSCRWAPSGRTQERLMLNSWLASIIFKPSSLIAVNDFLAYIVAVGLRHDRVRKRCPRRGSLRNKRDYSQFTP